MTTGGVASSGSEMGIPERGTSGVRVPDVASAGEVLAKLRSLWPFENDTVYVGLGHGGTRAHVGWIRERDRKATRLSGPSFAVAYQRAVTWTESNKTRVLIEAAESAAGTGE